jgi:hypothetical protein
MQSVCCILPPCGASLGLHELSPISIHPPLGIRLGQGSSRHPVRGTINPWTLRGVSSLGILAGDAHTFAPSLDSSEDLGRTNMPQI